jgi:Domain of unknown function (DUF222)
MELENFEAALEALIAAGAANYGDGASMEKLHHLEARFDSFMTEATAAFETGEEWAAAGAKTAASWISSRCRVPRAAAKRRVRLGRTLRHLPEVAEAWREGRIGEDVARAIASARRHRTEASMARDESLLVTQACDMGFEDFSRALAYWKQLADPDGAEASEEERKASRDVFLETSFSGMFLGQMTLDPVSGAIVANELNRLEHDLFEADCAQAKERLGRPARFDELARTSGQRRADALVEMATRSRTAPAEGIRPAPLFSVLVGFETASSRGERKELGELLRWFHISQGFAGSTVQALFDGSQVLGGEFRKIGALWHVLAQKAIGVFVRSSLPRAVRIAEIDLDSGGHRKGGVSVELSPLIPRNTPGQLCGQGSHGIGHRHVDLVG